jgi:hypothetical protein
MVILSEQKVLGNSPPFPSSPMHENVQIFFVFRMMAARVTHPFNLPVVLTQHQYGEFWLRGWKEIDSNITPTPTQMCRSNYSP